MEVRSGTSSEALAFVLECFFRTERKLALVMDVLAILLKSVLGSFGVNELEDFVTALFHDGDFGEELVCDDKVRGFEVDVNSGLKAAGLKIDVGEDGGWEGFRVEILDLTVVELESGVHVTGSHVGVFIKIQVKLSELCHVSPPVIVNEGSISILEADV